MAHFTQALKTVLDRSFAGKQSAMAAASDMQQADISKLVRDAAPLTAEKLEKLLTACDADTDRALLVHAAVRDFVGKHEYKARFTGSTEPSESLLREDLGGPVFRAHFPIDPRAEQVLRYLVNNVQSNGDIEDALKLLGKFLELPSLELLKPASGGGSAHFHDTIRHDATPLQHAAQEHHEP